MDIVTAFGGLASFEWYMAAVLACLICCAGASLVYISKTIF